MADIEAHHRELRALGCAISGRTDGVELHHAHGGTMLRFEACRRGAGQKVSDWLVIPLHRDYHTGRYNPEAMGVDSWEILFHSQVSLLDWVCRSTGRNVWKLAGIDREVK